MTTCTFYKKLKELTIANNTQWEFREVFTCSAIRVRIRSQYADHCPLTYVASKLFPNEKITHKLHYSKAARLLKLSPTDTARILEAADGMSLTSPTRRALLRATLLEN